MTKQKQIILSVFSFIMILSMVASCQVLSGSGESSAHSELSIETKQTELESEETKPSSAEESQTSPTGYTDGGIQFSSVFYDGQLYYMDQIVGVFSADELEVKLKELGAEEVGITAAETNHRWPNKDFEVSRLAAELPVFYAQEEQLLYVLSEDAKLRMFIPYEEELYDLD